MNSSWPRFDTSKTSPTTRSWSGRPLAVAAMASPTFRCASRSSALGASTSPGELNQRPATSRYPRWDESPRNTRALTASPMPGTSTLVPVSATTRDVSGCAVRIRVTSESGKPSLRVTITCTLPEEVSLSLIFWKLRGRPMATVTVATPRRMAINVSALRSGRANASPTPSTIGCGSSARSPRAAPWRASTRRLA